jgi:sortase (surface protein transpeptidase)
MVPRAQLRRSLPALLLAGVLLVTSSVAVAGFGARATRPAATDYAPSTQTPTVDAPPSEATPTGWSGPAASPVAAVDSAKAETSKPATQSKPAPAPTTKPAAKPKPAPKPAPQTGPVYRGRNHLWIPALGINRSVGFYYCGNPNAPGLGVYRWGCAGRNNTYLLAHAYAAFKPLHDAYVRGRLKRGMKAIYADASGRVRTYAIVWWRLTTPENGAFAYAAQSRPSMTLQTCVGSRSQYRLIVRLVAVG